MNPYHTMFLKIFFSAWKEFRIHCLEEPFSARLTKPKVFPRLFFGKTHTTEPPPLLTCNQGADGLTPQSAQQGVGIPQVQHEDRHVVFHTQGDGRAIHHSQPAVEDINIP